MTVDVSRRVTGVDAARGVALLGLAAVHVTALRTASGLPDPLHLLFSGGAAALFVTLAGVGLTLAAGGTTPAGPERTAVLRRRTARRAAVLFVLGLLCGWLGTNIAVILCHYALMFMLVLPLLGTGRRTLTAAAGAWLLLGPVLVFGLSALGQRWVGRDAFLFEARLWLTPAPEHLLAPHLLLTDLLLTGYYPVLSWTGFMVLGMALGRLPLASRRTATGLAVGGALVAVGAWVVGAAVRAVPGVIEQVAAATSQPAEELASTLLVGEYRLAWLVPDPLWLAMVTPHGGSPLEAVRAAGWAVTVLGLCLLICRRPGVLAGAGRVSLSLYVGHLVLLGALGLAGVPFAGVTAAAVLWALFLGAGLAAHRTGRRGPLENLTAAISRSGETSPVRR